ncbi:MAG TPA: sensor histidine kinase [Candidatus Ozemobacteraceae bacterium]|nr:sensor histidine kinase [Candidatus Ozemobacteraceae bacterium]
MIDTVRGAISQDMMAVKSGLGGILELVESWIMTMTGEEERRRHLECVASLLRERGQGLAAEDREACLGHLAAVIGSKETAMMASAGYRIKLQAMFKEQVERLQVRLDQLLRQVGKLADSLDETDVRESSGGGLVMAQEEERRRISREIHDGPAQSLASLTMRINFCLDHLTETELLKQELVDLKEAIGRSLKDIRRFIFDLRPMALDDLGLVPTLEQFMTAFKNRTGINVYIDIEGDRTPLSPETELAIFRVVQEAVNNAHRHAAARSIHAFLTYEQPFRRLSGVVKDDGRGFDVAETRKNYTSLKKLGLLSMEERIRIAGGEFDLISKPGEGTVVSFWVPL